MANGKTLIMSSVQIILMSTGVLSIATLLFMSMPNLLTSVSTAELPSLFSTLRSWLRPPYLYFIINAIILTIAATSRLHHNHHSTPAPPPSSAKLPSQQHHHNGHDQHDAIAVRADQFAPYGVVSVAEAVVDNVIGGGFYNDVVSMKDVEKVVEEREKRVVEEEFVSKRTEDKSTVVERSTWTPPPSSPSPPLMRQERVSPQIFSEKPPASSRFGPNRRPAKAKPAISEGGKSLRVSKPKKHDTLESTWKAITEGKHIPLARHLKKSDTWENQDRQIDLLDDSFPSPAVVKKSETFNDRTDYLPPPPPPPAILNKLKKEPSLGQDELNRRVEAFINKFNEDMRLQRQESMQQFMEMINRAT